MGWLSIVGLLLESEKRQYGNPLSSFKKFWISTQTLHLFCFWVIFGFPNTMNAKWKTNIIGVCLYIYTLYHATPYTKFLAWTNVCYFVDFIGLLSIFQKIIEGDHYNSVSQQNYVTSILSFLFAFRNGFDWSRSNLFNVFITFIITLKSRTKRWKKIWSLCIWLMNLFAIWGIK